MEEVVAGKRHTIYLAPFQGLTDAAYRRAFNAIFGGIDAAYAPYLSNLKGDLLTQDKMRDLLCEANRGVNTIPQILTKEAEEIILLSKTLSELGYRELNWNIGCPFPQVTRKLKGSGLLNHPDVIRSILDTVFPSLPLDLTIKARAGFQRNDDIFRLLELLDSYPVREIIIHPRTASQLYKGKADPLIFKACTLQSGKTLCYNGDIVNALSFGRLNSLLPATTHWMTGRGALMDPTLPSRLRDGRQWPDNEKRKAFSDFSRRLLNDSLQRNRNEKLTAARMKSVWSYLCHSFEDPVQVFRQIRKTHSVDEFLAAMDDILENQPIRKEITYETPDPGFHEETATGSIQG